MKSTNLWKLRIAIILVGYSIRQGLTLTAHSKTMSSFRDRSGRGGGGRGQFYREKYGNKNRGGRGRGDTGEERDQPINRNVNEVKTALFSDLIGRLRHIDGKSYPAYHDIEGSWKHEMFTLSIGRTQSDPFAPPTRCRLFVSSPTVGLPQELYSNRIRRVACADFINRIFHSLCVHLRADKSISGGGGGWNGPKGGDIQIACPGQYVLEQSAVVVTRDGDIIAQFTVNLPARGRTILGGKARDIFDDIIVSFVKKALIFEALDPLALERHILVVEDQSWLRSQLESKGLVAFIADDSLLPRRSGVDDRPFMPERDEMLVLFKSPQSFKIAFDLPKQHKRITGMGIRKGVSLIVGGGFNGKSTLLEALQVGVYNKIPGDGREYVVTVENAVKIRAEDGRSVANVDITPFIDNLPFGKQTSEFVTQDASGSTSQAANIVESIEMGSTCLLVDEDTCATNFMIRDAKMAKLVSSEKEPITPFIQKIRSLHNDLGISTILVIGGSGDYFEVADQIIMMDCYSCIDVTEKAKAIAMSESLLSPNNSFSFGKVTSRSPIGQKFDISNKISVRSIKMISYGEIEIDLSALEQIVQQNQTVSISFAMQLIPKLSPAGQHKSLLSVCNEIDDMIEKHGLDILAPGLYHGGFVRPRPYEIAGALNRFRKANTFQQIRSNPAPLC